MHACVRGAPPSPEICAHSINSNRQLVRSSDGALSYNKKKVEKHKNVECKRGEIPMQNNRDWE